MAAVPIDPIVLSNELRTILRVFNPPEYLDSYRLYAVRSSASSISTPISAAALKSSHVALTAPFGS
jgi:hypothetical protein